ncbi:MAG: DUF5050 domain-containing protein [Anaerolineaceae bacterium]|nr:MAG: DUF5050 domain-containing protein [Anaerolineaceae bacterium]
MSIYNIRIQLIILGVLDLSTIKKVLLTLFIITSITFAGVLLYSSGRTYLNDEDLIGNTTGNIYNGGLFCERDGKIYFSNDNDDGSLYVMNSDTTNIKKLYYDKAAYINVDENYIYYLRANNTRENASGSILMFNNTGIYRLKQNGRALKLISSNPGSYVTVRGNHVYYQNYDVNAGLFLYRNQTDGSLERLLLREAVIPSIIMDNKLYYVGVNEDHNINSLDLSSFTTRPCIEGNFAYPIFQGDYIYYIDQSNNYTINRMNKDGSSRFIIVDERCSTFNITNSGKYLYYQVDNMDKSKICRIDLTTMETEVLLDGHYKQIHVTEHYVFFKDFDNTNTYIVSADGSSKLGTFNPPNLNED